MPAALCRSVIPAKAGIHVPPPQRGGHRGATLSRSNDRWRTEMSERVAVVLGFDPGGAEKFGWSICPIDGGELGILKTGVASDALEVIRAVSSVLPPNTRVLAAGIDAPMFWSTTGTREVDPIIRDEIQRRGCGTASSTVQHPNSLRGACLVQGVLLGRYIRQRFNDVPITEAHPKALLWLLDDTERDRLNRLTNGLSEDKRDAVLAAFAAWSMYRRAQGWRNLYLDEPNPILPLGTPVSYWMPIPPVSSEGGGRRDADSA